MKIDDLYLIMSTQNKSFVADKKDFYKRSKDITNAFIWISFDEAKQNIPSDLELDWEVVTLGWVLREYLTEV